MKDNTSFQLVELNEILSFPNFDILQKQSSNMAKWCFKLENLGYSSHISSKKMILPDREDLAKTDLYCKILLGAKNAYFSVTQEETGNNNAQHCSNSQISTEKKLRQNENYKPSIQILQEENEIAICKNIQVNDTKGENEKSRQRKFTEYLNSHLLCSQEDSMQIKNGASHLENYFPPIKKLKNCQNHSRQQTLSAFFTNK